MTAKILELTDESRPFKNKDDTEYKEIHNQIKRKIKQAKGKWLRE